MFDTPAARPIVHPASGGMRYPLGRVLAPGRLPGRVVAASAVPTWLAVALAIVSLLVTIEVIGYIDAVAHDFLQVMFARWESTSRIPTGAAMVFLEVAFQHIRPHVIPAVLDGRAGMITGLSAGMCLVVLLESMNLVLLAPLATGTGQKITRVLRKTRKVLLALGGAWLLEWSVLGLVLFLGTSTLLLRTIEMMYVRISYVLLDDLTALGLEVCLAALLAAWVTRLTQAAGCLAPLPSGPLPQRCSHCGYLLTGVPQNTPCRECGNGDPAEADRQRTDSPWLNHKALGGYRALAATSSAMLRRPGRFFAGVTTLTDVRQGLRFVRWNLGLAVMAWLLATPGITVELMEPDDIYVSGKMVSAIEIGLLVAFGSALAAALLIGLITSLMGWAISRVREEPAWPIAVNSGCYLSAVLPRIAVAQALWVTALFTAEQSVDRGLWIHLARQWWTQTGIPWEVLLSLLFAAPTLAGILLLARTTFVCYRNVRYACR
jgi:hypothetical protein